MATAAVAGKPVAVVVAVAAAVVVVVAAAVAAKEAVSSETLPRPMPASCIRWL